MNLENYSLTDMLAIQQAYCFARGAHSGRAQVRKYNGEPYHQHVKRVADQVMAMNYHAEFVMAALLHDVVEDTGIELSEIGELFGGDVREHVYNLTEERPEGFNRAQRKDLYNAKLAQTCKEIQTIKLIDTLDNLDDMEIFDPKFCEQFVKEKRLLLPLLTKADPVWIHRVESRLTYLERFLKER